MKEKDEQKKKRSALIIMILTLIVSVVGATYAFFSISTATNNAITGKAATADLDLNIIRVVPTKEDWNHSNKVIIPQLSSDIGTAMNSCIDANGDVVCQVYQIKVTNQGSAQVVVDGDITFTGTQNMPNLKWKIYESNTELTGTNISTLVSQEPTKTITEAAKVKFTQNVTLTPINNTGNSKYYYAVLWIESVINPDGTPGIQTDHGTYKASVSFNSSNGIGVTSTFTS